MRSKKFVGNVYGACAFLTKTTWANEIDLEWEFHGGRLDGDVTAELHEIGPSTVWVSYGDGRPGGGCYYRRHDFMTATEARAHFREMSRRLWARTKEADEAERK